MPEAQQSQRSAKTLSKASRPQGRSPTCKTRGRYKSCLVKCKNQSTHHERGGRGACACGQFYEVFLYFNLFCTCKDDMNIFQSIVVLSSINVIFASTLGTVVSLLNKGGNE